MDLLSPFGCPSNMYTHAQLTAHTHLLHAHGPQGWKPVRNPMMDHVHLGEMWRG